MTFEELINQLNVGTGEGAISGGGSGSAYGPAYSQGYGFGTPGTFDPETGQSNLQQNVEGGYSPWGSGFTQEQLAPGSTYIWEETGAAGLAQRLANMYGYTGGGAPEGTTWQEIGMTMNPVSFKQLLGAEYGAMRPGIERGVGSLKGELLANLRKVKTGGFASSGFANRQRQAARDIFGKKATDILTSEGQKRQDLMASLLEQNVANQEIMQSWFPASGSV